MSNAAVGGWPMFAQEGFKAFVNQNKQDPNAGKFSLVVADTLTMQLELSRDGYATHWSASGRSRWARRQWRRLLKIKKGVSSRSS